MNQPERPCDCHFDLQDDRLQLLAQFFASTRSALVALHDPISGDDSWALGCRGFARWRNQLLNKAKSGEWPWLGIINPGKKFIFSIGSVPVRFFKGSINRIPTRTLVYNFNECAQLSLAFPDGGNDYGALKWRFAIETDHFGEPSSVIFAALSGEGEDANVVFHWKIPFEMESQCIELGSIRTDDMVELPAPAVEIPLTEKDIAANDE
jgi:hypothetical protein